MGVHGHMEDEEGRREGNEERKKGIKEKLRTRERRMAGGMDEGMSEKKRGKGIG